MPLCGLRMRSEDCFVAAQKGKLILEAEHVDMLLKGVDLLVQIAQIDEPEIEAWQSTHATAIDAVVTNIVAIQERNAARSAAPPEIGEAVVLEASRYPPSSTTPEIVDPGPTSMDDAQSCANVESPRSSSLTERRSEEQDREQPSPETTSSNRERDRVVRVTAESLTRLMSLAGRGLGAKSPTPAAR